MNDWLKKNKKNERYLTLSDRLSVSAKAMKKIDKIIEQNRLGSRTV